MATSTSLSPFVALGLKDSQFGLGDLSVIPMLGYDYGNLHYNVSLPFFFPTGRIFRCDGQARAARRGRHPEPQQEPPGIDPTLGVTYLNPKNGIEVSGALGITFSAPNNATDYQTAPELHFEGTLAQHFQDGLVLAATGYAYQQLGNDSGDGAEQLQKVLGADSLQARVFGVGPLIGYSTKIGDNTVSMKVKYIHELGAKRRVEGDVVWGNLTIGF